MNTNEMQMIELAPAELKEIEGGAITLAAAALFVGGAALGFVAVVGTAYLIYKLAT
jgi:hypothetical protein